MLFSFALLFPLDCLLPAKEGKHVRGPTGHVWNLLSTSGLEENALRQHRDELRVIRSILLNEGRKKIYVYSFWSISPYLSRSKL